MFRRIAMMFVVLAFAATACGDGTSGGADSTTVPPSTSSSPTTTSTTSAPTSTTTTSATTTTLAPTTTTTVPTPPDEVVDPGTAASLPDGTSVVVMGIYFDESGAVQLCSALAESYPPQCGGPAIDVTGIGRGDVVGVTTVREPELADVAWTNFLVTVEGVVRGGSLEAEAVRQVSFEAVDGDIRVRLAIEPPELRAGGSVAFALDVTNLATDPIDVVFSSGQDADVRIIDAKGESVYTWSATVSFIQVVRTITLEPGVPYGVVLGDQLQVPPGDYVVEAGFVARELSQILVTADITIS